MSDSQPSQCLSDSDLNRYHAGELDEAEEARVREHLAECQKCAQRDAELVAQHEDLLGRVKGMKLSEAPGGQPGPTRTRRRERAGRGRGAEAEGKTAQMLGRFIGPYKLLEVLGEGGFGVVYLAEQVEPVRRRVALKIIKPGMDSRAVIARFEAEQQALAMMDHPHVAKVFDAGMTEGGRSYFVMEHVPGVTLT